jgi:hypothetical protein
MLCRIGLRSGTLSFLKRIFSPTKPEEQALEELYTRLCMSMTGGPEATTRKAVRDLIRQAKEEALSEGAHRIPENFGDLLLAKEKDGDPLAQKMLAKKRSEGVTDQDVRWWWNMSDLERRLMTKVDEWFRLALVMQKQEAGVTVEEAVAEIRKSQPVNGDPNDTTHTKGEDRPLPHELKDRVNVWVQDAMVTGELTREKLLQATSFNALVREAIRQGRL